MLLHSQRIREEVWQRLRTIFNGYTNGAECIGQEQLARLVQEVLREDTQRELDYVMLNLNRIDTDANGSIDFHEFATFLLKRHCGEIALQKMHLNGRVQHGKDRKLTCNEFMQLLNSAYSFLGVVVDAEQANSIFQQADTDRDGLITYVQYFTYIDQYLARANPTTTTVTVPTKTSQKEMLSRLRRFIWQELKRIYERYDLNHSDTLDAGEIEIICREVLKETNKSELDSILFNLLRLGSNGEVSFREFASFFLKYTGDLGLSRLSKLGLQRRRLARDQFASLFRSAYSYLPVSRISDALLHRIFLQIDNNRDGWISYQEFSDWVEKFLAVVSYFGKEYYTQEDDESLQLGQSLIASQSSARQKQPSRQNSLSPPKGTNIPPTTSYTYLSTIPDTVQSNNILASVVTETRQNRPPALSTGGRVSKVPSSFHFSSQDLAVKVRRQVLSLIRKFDGNGNLQLEQHEIIALLQSQLKENKNEIAYVIGNVFRYDRDNDKRITYDELANFLLEMHSGEMAIQRLHMHNTYARGAERMMDGREFAVTINYALSFFELQADEETLWTLFSDVDRNRDGWISYQEYFEFLRNYFGSESYVVTSGLLKVSGQGGFQHEANLILNNAGLSLEEKLRRLYNLQLGYHVFRGDSSQTRQIGRPEIVTLLTIIFGYASADVEKILNAEGFFNSANSITFDQFAKFMLGSHLRKYSLRNYLLKYRVQRAGEQLMSLEEFAAAVSFCLGLTIPVRPELLAACFTTLDTDRDGFISFGQFNEFLGGLFEPKNKVLGQSTSVNLQSPSTTEEEFCREIWSELKKLYDQYDTTHRNQLGQAGLQKFCREALLESSHKELNYITVSLLKMSSRDGQMPPSGTSVSFEQFAPFILNYVAETALKRFHLQQKPGKERLTRDEFTVVVRSAYNFLRSIRKRTDQIHRVFDRLDRDRTAQVTYSQFISWVHFEVARKPRY